MSTDNDTLATAATVANEIEGTLLQNALQQHGIAAALTGTYTSAFQAAAPGYVRVMVKESDLSAAQAVIAEHAGVEFEGGVETVSDDEALAQPARKVGGETSAILRWLTAILVVYFVAEVNLGQGNLALGLAFLAISVGLLFWKLRRIRLTDDRSA